MRSEELAYEIRKNAIKMVNHAHASHLGGILSCADIVAVLYSEVAHVNPKNPRDLMRDRIVLSKGHNGVAIYVALAKLGFLMKNYLKPMAIMVVCFLATFHTKTFLAWSFLLDH